MHAKLDPMDARMVVAHEGPDITFHAFKTGCMANGGYYMEEYAQLGITCPKSSSRWIPIR